MKEKLVLISIYGGNLRIMDVKVLRETEKQFVLDNAFRNKLNKTELGEYIKSVGIFCYESQAPGLAIAQLDKNIETVTKTIEAARQPGAVQGRTPSIKKPGQ